MEGGSSVSALERSEVKLQCLPSARRSSERRTLKRHCHVAVTEQELTLNGKYGERFVNEYEIVIVGIMLWNKKNITFKGMLLKVMLVIYVL